MDIEPAIWVASATPAHARQFREPLQDACDRFGIDNEKRLTHFLAQCAHESQGFSRLIENLNYTSAARLTKVWPRRFPTEESARAYVRNPKKLANKVYNGRMGNRISTDDGFVYRGRGILQITGRDNYRAATDGTDLPLIDHPDMACTPEGASLTAAWFWESRKLSEYADEDTPDAFYRITRAINGGTNGLEDRLMRLNELRRAVGLPVFQLQRK